MSSHATTSLVEPGQRTHAFKLTRVRACFRRFSCSFSATRLADCTERDDSALGISDDISADSPAGAVPALRFAETRGVIGSFRPARAVASGSVHVAPPNAGGCSRVTLGRLPSRQGAGATGGSVRGGTSTVSSPDRPTPDGPMRPAYASLAAEAGAPGRLAPAGKPATAGRLPGTACFHSVDDPHFWQ